MKLPYTAVDVRDTFMLEMRGFFLLLLNSLGEVVQLDEIRGVRGNVTGESLQGLYRRHSVA